MNDDSPLSSYTRCTTEEPETAEASPTAARADESDDTVSEYEQSCDDAESSESEESDCFKTLPYQGKFEPYF